MAGVGPAAVAEAVGAEGSPAPAEGAGTSAPEGGAAQPGGEGSAAQPAGEQPAGEGPAKDQPQPGQEGEHHVPWARFREAQTGRTQLRHQFNQAQEEWTNREQELTTQLTEERQGGETMRSDYNQIVGMLNANPDIAQALMARYGQGQPVGPDGQPVAPSAAPLFPARPGPASASKEAAPLHPDLRRWGETVDRLDQRMSTQEQQAIEATRQAGFRQTEQQLDTQVAKWLEPKGYGKEWVEDAKEFVLKRAREMPDLELEDVPYVLADWFKRTEGRVNARVQGVLQGKRQDSALPATPGGSPTPVRAATPGGANDGTTATQMEELLRGRGWNG